MQDDSLCLASVRISLCADFCSLLTFVSICRLAHWTDSFTVTHLVVNTFTFHFNLSSMFCPLVSNTQSLSHGLLSVWSHSTIGLVVRMSILDTKG